MIVMEFSKGECQHCTIVNATTIPKSRKTIICLFSETVAEKIRILRRNQYAN